MQRETANSIAMIGIPSLRRACGRAAVLVCVCFVLAFAGRAPAQVVDGAAIASAHPAASAAGHDALERGGNAFDAAVAIAAALAVVEPYSSGFGGGGYFLLHRAVDGFEVMIDARETAPAQASAGMYLDAVGEPIPGASLNGARSAAIPGLAAGLAHLAQHYGRLALADNLAAAIRLAREGFPVDGRYARLAQMRERTLVAAGGARVFFDGGKPPRPGFVLKQPQLAATIAAFAARGAAGFYSGAVAGALVDSVRAAGGIWGPADLAGYRVIERAPIKFTYHGARITSAPPSSAGGVTLAQALNILERFPLGDARAPAGAQLVVEALRRAFQDRNARLGDTDFVAVPVARLIFRCSVEVSLCRGADARE